MIKCVITKYYNKVKKNSIEPNTNIKYHPIYPLGGKREQKLKPNLESYCGHSTLLLHELYLRIGRIVLFFEDYIEIDKKDCYSFGQPETRPFCF